MLTLKGRKSLFALSLLCFSSSVWVNGAGDGGKKYGTESSASSTISRTSLADLFEKDPRKTLADLIAEESGKGTEKKTTLAELIREEGIGEKEFDQLVEEIGDNEYKRVFLIN
ncbi:hypothetical protein niasHT_004192 [Heterodera trifolii]|uniref:Uncharacterized protein n=1 Tax=Heterodera trifolii TaxID=157864 RepID=A0ABD2MFE1_9BILA